MALAIAGVVLDRRIAPLLVALGACSVEEAPLEGGRGDTDGEDALISVTVVNRPARGSISLVLRPQDPAASPFAASTDLPLADRQTYWSFVVSPLRGPRIPGRLLLFTQLGSEAKLAGTFDLDRRSQSPPYRMESHDGRTIPHWHFNCYFDEKRCEAHDLRLDTAEAFLISVSTWNVESVETAPVGYAFATFFDIPVNLPERTVGTFAPSADGTASEMIVYPPPPVLRTPLPEAVLRLGFAQGGRIETYATARIGPIATTPFTFDERGGVPLLKYHFNCFLSAKTCEIYRPE